MGQVKSRAYFILSEKPEPPRVNSGRFVEVARLTDRFELDQRGGRTARLLRVIRTDQAADGPLQECEFQVDRA